ncbi:hypothetical protein FQN54_000422 [Arachnomyces sp. PD_36]|nr:hypothetical protein FQN54_000422 [Arachnomyces sp. PD_36]
MAAPPEITIQDLNGKFVMDKALSNNPDDILKLQGISWLTRKAIGLATITLAVTEEDKPTEEDPNGPPITHVTIGQTATGGIPGTTESRILDFVERPHTDHIFGSVKGRTRWCRGAKAEDGKIRPNPEILSKVGNEAEDVAVSKFLRGETLADGSETEGFLVEKVAGVLATEEGTDADNGIFLQSYVESIDNGWTAEQIWGFQIIDGIRYHTRNVAVVKNGQVQKARLVYSFVGRE